MRIWGCRTLKVILGNLKDKGEEIQTFLEPRVGTKPSLSGGALEMEDSAIRKGVRPKQVKTYLKRFLHQKGLRKTFRVLVSGSQLTIQELERKEEEEKKEAPKKEEEKEAPPKVEKEEKEQKREKEERPKPKKASKPKKSRAKKG